MIRSHHLVRNVPSYFDEVESRCQSNQEARPASTPVHTPDVSSHMRNRWGLILVRTSYGWRDLISLWTRSMDRCVALPSHLPTLSYLRHMISSKKGDVLDSIDDDDDIEWPDNHLIIAMIRTPRLYKSYWSWFVSTVLLDSKRNRGSSVRNT